ncbi:MAG: SDR family oxidoreductase [Eubacteriales bacterium]|nr:SDR family oxidoreductase [Eubacteriales bacterium]
MAIACITGASSGIGKEFAFRLSRKGFDLILVARNTDALEKLAAALPTKCEIITCDLSSPKKCKKLGETLGKKRISILINNAGFGNVGSFIESDLEKELAMIDVNIKALHILTKALLPQMVQRDSGYILNVASSAGLMQGGPYMAAYYATKAYVTSMTCAIYEELREQGSHVHISMLCPGPVDTNFNEVANVKFALPGISVKYCVDYCLRQMSRGRLTIIPSPLMQLAMFFCKHMPKKLLLPITAKQQMKKM